MNFSQLSNQIFDKCIENYHLTDNVDAPIENPYELKTIEFYLYLKNWIDTVQWHLEDIIRNPEIEPVEALKIKRRIDKSNQDRTDLVELIDSYMLDKYKDVAVKESAVINTESPAWAIDRLSIPGYINGKKVFGKGESKPAIRKTEPEKTMGDDE